VYKPDTLKEEIQFPSDNAWTGSAPTQPGRLMLFGMNSRIEVDPEDENPDPERRKKNFIARLVQAVRFHAPDDTKKEKPIDLPAGVEVYLPPEYLISPARDAVANAANGGAFVEALIPYLQKLNPTIYPANDASKSRTVLPPPLLRQGQRVQSDWMFQFLRNPFTVRPATVLRMPKFNMSDADAQALVDYFGALDKVMNPGVGLEYPYSRVVQQDDEYWRKVNAEYRHRLGPKLEERAKAMQPAWEQALRARVADLRGKIGIAEATVKATEEPEAKKLVQKQLDDLQAELKTSQSRLEKKDYAALRKDWEERVYFTDAYRMITNSKSICLTCHQIGDILAKEQQGPNLGQVSNRLRSDWSLHWIGNPNRMFAYTPTMPANFTKESLKDFQQFFEGSSKDQAIAARDVLMNFPKVANMPENRFASGGGN
jgi:cbb3-type cytochrome oxidase cytochrome c subunit